MKRKDSVTITFLGGLGEIGRNCACIESDGRMVILDCGVMFPEPDMPGVDLVLPNFDYVYERAGTVDGLILTHGHEDHTGGLPYLLRELKIPVYGSALTLALARHRVEEAGLAGRAQFRVVKDGDLVQIGPFGVEFIPVTHSVPHGFATAFHTSQGVILHSGDFKLDLSPIDGRFTDLSRIGSLAHNEGIRLLMSDSTNADEPGFTLSESVVGEAISRVMVANPGKRIVAACFASHIHRVQQIATAARESGRKIVALGRSMEKNIELARGLGLLDLPEKDQVPVESLSSLDPGKVCVICTGSQGEPLSALALLAAGESRVMKLGKDDLVIISAHPIPGNEWAVGKVINGLTRRGAEVIHTGIEQVHVSGHARRSELRTMLSLTRPEYFIPVHGELRHLVQHAQLAVQSGVPAGNALVCEDGNRVRLGSDGLVRLAAIPAGFLFVDGTVGDVSHGVLRDRRALAEEGMIVVMAVVDLHAGEVVGTPEIVTRGWVHAKEAEDLLEEAAAVVRTSLEKAIADGASDDETLHRHARQALGRLVGERTKRRPLIVPVVVIV
ncbi:MAG: ribonuclease J [Acidimicrobiales bacterium]